MSVEFRNRSACWLWGFAAAWMSGLAAMTYVVLRDGGIKGYSWEATACLGAIFWSAGVGLVLFVASRPSFSVTVYPRSHVVVTWRYPYRTVCHSVPVVNAAHATVVDSKDSDGDPYYFARIVIAGRAVDLAEGHAREVCEEVSARFNRALDRNGRI